MKNMDDTMIRTEIDDIMDRVDNIVKSIPELNPPKIEEPETENKIQVKPEV